MNFSCDLINGKKVKVQIYILSGTGNVWDTLKKGRTGCPTAMCRGGCLEQR